MTASARKTPYGRRAKTMTHDVAEIGRMEMDIRRAVLDTYFMGRGLPYLRQRVTEIITKGRGKVEILGLRQAATKSLLAFAERQWRTITAIRGAALYLAICRLNGAGGYSAKMSAETAREIIDTEGLTGVPLRMYQRDYYRDKIKPTLDRLMQETPIDPGDVSGRNSLRGRAEMEVRYQYNQDQVDTLKESGARLVICSTHANCSERCRPWQGRVYSLDGTKGTAPDGRKYVPLETATDIYYTTKAGVTYKNGLLGFNCRHTLVPFEKGLSFPRFSQADEKRAYDLNQRQRALERAVRKSRVEELTTKGIDRDAYRDARDKVKRGTERLKRFCEENDLVFDETRTRF